MELKNNGKYVLFNIVKKEIVAICDEYPLLVKFMSHHRYICEDSVVREVKKKVFDEMLIKYDDLYLVEIDNIVVRQQDVGLFLRLKDEETASIGNSIRGIERMLEWNSLKKKERNKLQEALTVLYKYLDVEKKLLNKSGIVEICSDIYYLDNLREIEHKIN